MEALDRDIARAELQAAERLVGRLDADAKVCICDGSHKNVHREVSLTTPPPLPQMNDTLATILP